MKPLAEAQSKAMRAYTQSRQYIRESKLEASIKCMDTSYALKGKTIPN